MGQGSPAATADRSEYPSWPGTWSLEGRGSVFPDYPHALVCGDLPEAAAGPIGPGHDQALGFTGLAETEVGQLRPSRGDTSTPCADPGRLGTTICDELDGGADALGIGPGHLQLHIEPASASALAQEELGASEDLAPQEIGPAILVQVCKDRAATDPFFVQTPERGLFEEAPIGLLDEQGIGLGLGVDEGVLFIGVVLPVPVVHEEVEQTVVVEVHPVQPPAHLAVVN
jgi:hypothetical protein